MFNLEAITAHLAEIAQRPEAVPTDLRREAAVRLNGHMDPHPLIVNGPEGLAMRIETVEGSKSGPTIWVLVPEIWGKLEP